MKILISKIRYDATNLTGITKIFIKYVRYNWISYGWLIIYITNFSVFVELWDNYARDDFIGSVRKRVLFS